MPLSPSEMVLLHGELFAGEARNSNYSVRLLYHNYIVSSEQLGWSLITAAVLASEQAGYIRLQVAARAKYGRVHPSAIYMTAGSMPMNWAQWSIEDRLCKMLSQGASPYPLEEFIFVFLEQYFRRWASHAWRFITAQAMQGLVVRKLLQVPSDFPYKIGYNLEDCYLLEPVAGLIARQSIEPTQRLFSETAQRRPDVWAALYGDVDLAVRRRAKRAGSIGL